MHTMCILLRFTLMHVSHLFLMVTNSSPPNLSNPTCPWESSGLLLKFSWCHSLTPVWTASRVLASGVFGLDPIEPHLVPRLEQIVIMVACILKTRHQRLRAVSLESYVYCRHAPCDCFCYKPKDLSCESFASSDPWIIALSLLLIWLPVYVGSTSLLLAELTTLSMADTPTLHFHKIDATSIGFTWGDQYRNIMSTMLNVVTFSEARLAPMTPGIPHSATVANSRDAQPAHSTPLPPYFPQGLHRFHLWHWISWQTSGAPLFQNNDLCSTCTPEVLKLGSLVRAARVSTVL